MLPNTRETLSSGENRGDFVDKKTNRMVRGYLVVSDNVKPKHGANIMEQGEKIEFDLAGMELTSLQPVQHFEAVLKSVLITQQCYGYAEYSIKAFHLPLTKANRLGMGKRLGEEIARTANLN